jgi:phage antirepressor YoqD-like protein
MTNIIPIIAGVQINTDKEGRFNLNALHKASGQNPNKAPAQWMRTQQSKEIVQELVDMQICTSPIDSNKGGANQGTFAHELLAVSYAGWISPKFQLQVNQAFLDSKKPANDSIANMSRMDILKIAMQAEEEKQQLLAHIEEDKPKVEFHDQVVAAPDCISVAQAAKILGTGQRRLFDYLRKIHWVSRRNEPYQEKINTGYMNVKLGSFQHPDHGLKQSVTPLITGKGLAKLKILLHSEMAA